MAGTLVADVMQSGASGTPPAFKDSGGNEIGQLCRAWVHFNGTTTPASIISSFNVSLVTRSATGTYDITMSSNTGISDTNYTVITGSSGASTTTDPSATRTATLFSILTRNSSWNAANYPTVAAAVYR